ncbi:uncharacterized protein FOMMEDRAFT_156546 [Fomitiporia mediterranea MF3/22]|uniref:uncharacterized protein n=1 Tax=Fomitiporia mediterranea (strain MF3/22) TaxID=694068 RepID=UPI0004408A0D|nr:uncharacterized protein FOMMEDRAFT_156546 [Fomitiporia mediterranea MF3/22]EJD03172.1 hypothetical protein FOMMEDRAFT_156546 [Fomitiporia mediterranea MF3/22]
MVYGSAISTPLSGLALVFNVLIWLGTSQLRRSNSIPLDDPREELVDRPGLGQSMGITKMLLVLPYVAFVLAALFFAIKASQGQLSIDRSQDALYCSVKNEHGVPYISTVIILACVIFEILIIVRLVKLRRKFKVSKDKLGTDKFIRLFIRTSVFTVCAGLSLLAAAQFWFEPRSDFMYAHIIQASLPFAAFLIFGTQKDLLTVWGIIPLWNGLLDLRKKSSPPCLDGNEISQAPDDSQDIRKPLVRTGESQTQKPLALVIQSVPSATGVSNGSGCSTISISGPRR